MICKQLEKLQARYKQWHLLPHHQAALTPPISLRKMGRQQQLTQSTEHVIESSNFILPTNYVIPKSLKVGHWLSETNIYSPFSHSHFQPAPRLYVKYANVIQCELKTNLRNFILNHQKHQFFFVVSFVQKEADPKIQ